MGRPRRVPAEAEVYPEPALVAVVAGLAAAVLTNAKTSCLAIPETRPL